MTKAFENPCVLPRWCTVGVLSYVTSSRIMLQMYVNIVIPRGSRAHITEISMKKSPLWRFFTVLKLSENTRIVQDQSLQHFDRCLLKLGNGDLPTAELPDSTHIQPENPYKIQDDPGIAIRESRRHIVNKTFPDINANFHAPEQQWILG